MYTDEELTEAVSNSESYSETLRYLGRQITGSAHKAIKNKIALLGLDVSHFGKNRSRLAKESSTLKKSWQEILLHNENKKSRESGKRLTEALIESGRDHKCEKCGNEGEWQDEPITLEVDHIDGNWKNNLKENLRFMCPNCHSQTCNFFNKGTTYYCECGEMKLKASVLCTKCNSKRPKINQRKVERPSKEVLAEEIKNNNWVALGKKYGVTDNAVRKWAKSYKII